MNSLCIFNRFLEVFKISKRVPALHVAVMSAAPAPCGGRVATAARDGTVLLWEAEGDAAGSFVLETRLEAPAGACAGYGAGKRLTATATATPGSTGEDVGEECRVRVNDNVPCGVETGGAHLAWFDAGAGAAILAVCKGSAVTVYGESPRSGAVCDGAGGNGVDASLGHGTFGHIDRLGGGSGGGGGSKDEWVDWGGHGTGRGGWVGFARADIPPEMAVVGGAADGGAAASVGAIDRKSVV